MKIIVCGAGNVGRSIVSYLMLGNNDIVVIDNDANSLNALAKELEDFMLDIRNKYLGSG